MNDMHRAGTKVTKTTISNTLGQEGLESCSARCVPLLKPVHVQACLKFAREHMDDPEEDWENIMWSDETKIELFGKNSTCRVWRKKNAELQEHHIYCEAWRWTHHALGLFFCKGDRMTDSC